MSKSNVGRSGAAVPALNDVAKLAAAIVGVIVMLAGGIFVEFGSPRRDSAVAGTAGRAPGMESGQAVLATQFQDSTPLPSCEGADPEVGQLLFENTCATCHGPDGRGLPHQGVNLRLSRFVARHSDPQLVGFLRVGRQPKDPETVSGLYMPARGGNLALDDESLVNIVAHLRNLQKSDSPQPVGEPQ